MVSGISETVMCTIFGMLPAIFNFIRGVRCNDNIGICVPAKSGKTQISKSFIHSEKVELLDIENAVRLNCDDETLKKLDVLKASGELATYNSKFYVLARDYLKDLKKKFKKSYYVLSSDKDLLKYLGCKHIYVFSPSNDFWTKIKNNLPIDELEIAEKNRTEILLANGRRDLFVYNSFEELAVLLNKVLKLKHKL